MIPTETFTGILPALLLGAAIGAVVATVFFNRRLGRMRDECTRLSTELEFERKSSAGQQALHEQLNRQFKDIFNAMAADALKDNNAQFLRLAKENLEKLHIKAEGELEKREKAIENLVKPSAMHSKKPRRRYARWKQTGSRPMVH